MIIVKISATANSLLTISALKSKRSKKYKLRLEDYLRKFSSKESSDEIVIISILYLMKR